MDLMVNVSDVRLIARLVRRCVGMLALCIATGALAQNTLSATASPAPSGGLTHEEGLALAKARACLGCHQVNNKRVGPSFSAIAQRHADKEGAIPYMVQVIQKGGRGQWGAVPMPGQSVNAQDAQKLAQWIITTRK